MNVIALVITPFKERKRGGGNNIGSIQILISAEPWKRKVFNGLVQVIVQSTGNPGILTLKAAFQGLMPFVSKIFVED